jgi:D-tyrosyl-tRNA(Tyr) deacylase
LRPSFDAAASPAEAERLYERYCDLLRQDGLTVQTGVFQATMTVQLVNNGPVTILLDSQKNF